MKIFLGIPAADGLGLGKAFVIPDAVERSIPQKKITRDKLADGWNKFQAAVGAVTEQIEAQLSRLPKNSALDKVQHDLLEAYILMLEDPIFIAELKSAYEKSLVNIEYVVAEKASEYAEKLRSLGDEHLAERAHDIVDVFNLVIDNMMSIHKFNVGEVPDGAVVVATTLSPTDTILLSKRNIAGLALEGGGVSSHIVILARNYGIPTVTGLKNIARQIHTGDTLVVNGMTAEVILNPDVKTLAEYKEKIDKEKRRARALKSFVNKEARTKDGTTFTLCANIGTPEEAERALESGADGIGLFRTEFLFMSAMGGAAGNAYHSFDEDTQFNAYRHVLGIMEGKPVTIRTLDAGGDKLIRSADIPDMQEKNPLMGLRAVRLSLAHPQIMKTQLRALYRASIYGNLKIMLPLITTVEQVKQCLAMADTVKAELRAENIPFNADVPIGIMIETAAAAVASDSFVNVCAFFSIGTNDLTQYTLGVDRENPAVSNLYDEFNLAVLRLIETTLKNAQKADIPVSVCGEMAGRTDSMLVLAGMGFRNLSMSSKLIPEAKETLSRFTIDELRSISAGHFTTL